MVEDQIKEEEEEGEEHQGEEEESSRRRRKKKREKKRKKEKQLQVRVEAVPESADRAAPLVGYFPTGFDPQRRGKEVGEPKVRVFRNLKWPGRLELAVRPSRADGSAANVEFVGSSYAGEAAQPQVCTYALGVLDKEKQTLRVMPIAANKIFRLEPRVIGKASGSSEPVEEARNEELNTEALGEKMRQLTNLYGAKRDKDIVQKLTTLKKQQDDPNIKERLENQMKDVQINKETLEKDKGETIRNIPPHDPAATTPEKAYLIDKIINKKEWDQLLDVLEYMQSEETTTEFWQGNGYPSFICNRIQKLEQIQDEEEKKRLACISSYITHLLKFFEIASQPRKSLSTVHGGSSSYDGIPRFTYNKFVKLFADPESYALTNERKDLLISYILVLTLFVDSFETEPLDIARDLKMTTLSLRPHYELLGCKFSQGSKLQTLITLPVPLKFPDMSKKRKRRR
ncbi:hypothetical protein Taro_020034 [Colocasia esculenta]|uniref:DNA-directed RNA polymerase I subunit rpa49 n=1 Tax=Colocasia esculenta TaxID=4460 RepID=A0A843V0X3_COLES|nr:hypothetical protein [Colocasia esculenta]